MAMNHDHHPHFVHLKTLQKNGQYQEIIDYISTYREELLSLDPLFLLRLEVDALNELGLLESRDELLKNYEDGPYISQAFDDELKAIKSQIKRQKRSAKHDYSYGEIKRLLAVDAPYSQQLIAFNYLQTVDPTPYLPLIRHLVSHARAIEPQLLGLFLLMKAGDETPLTFTSCNLNRTHHVIPKNLPLPFTSEEEIILLDAVENLSSNVTVNQFAKTIYERLVLHLFPEPIPNEDVIFILIFIESEARHLLGEVGYPEALLKKHDIPLEIYQPYEKLYRQALATGENLS